MVSNWAVEGVFSFRITNKYVMLIKVFFLNLYFMSKPLNFKYYVKVSYIFKLKNIFCVRYEPILSES